MLLIFEIWNVLTLHLSERIEGTFISSLFLLEIYLILIKFGISLYLLLFTQFVFQQMVLARKIKFGIKVQLIQIVYLITTH